MNPWDQSNSGAVISDDEKYRYALWRRWREPSRHPFFDNGLATFVMLNPSTADAMTDDPTVRRCKGFAESWGYEGMIVVNLFAYRATDPSELVPLSEQEAQGPDNYRWLENALSCTMTRVAAWGGKVPNGKAEYLLGLLQRWDLRALKINKDGSPAHPLYLPKDLSPMHKWPEVGHD